MKLVILAGGEGTRLFPFTSVLHKCMFPIAGKPCIRRIIDDAIKKEFREIVLCINKQWESTFKHELRDLNIYFSISDKPLGTVGELLNARDKIGNERFLLRYGDDLTDIDYQSVINFHLKNKASATLVATTLYRLPIGIIECDQSNRILRFIEKPNLNKLFWAATAVLEPDVFEHMSIGGDMGRNVFPAMINAGKRLYVFINDREWFDVGNIEHWKRANKYFCESERI